MPDLFATVFSRMGIKPDKKFFNGFGGTTPATDEGKPIEALL